METNVRPIQEVVAAERSFFNRVYLWMMIGLMATALSAAYVIANPIILYKIAMSDFLYWGLIIGELALVWYMTARVQHMSFGQLVFGMSLYAVLNGVTLSLILWAYADAIAPAFFITAGTFGAMSLYGFTTKKDLSSMSSFLMMGLFGLIIAGVVNMFFRSDMMSFVISILGVVVFTLLTAYDTNKLKAIAAIGVDTEDGKKVAMMGALNLYLDFINLFLYILRLLSRKR